MLNKLYSKKGQVSMEIGILVAAAVIVSAIAGYYYASQVTFLGTCPPDSANITCDAFVGVALNYSDKMFNL